MPKWLLKTKFHENKQTRKTLSNQWLINGLLLRIFGSFLFANCILTQNWHWHSSDVKEILNIIAHGILITELKESQNEEEQWQRYNYTKADKTIHDHSLPIYSFIQSPSQIQHTPPNVHTRPIQSKHEVELKSQGNTSTMGAAQRVNQRWVTMRMIQCRGWVWRPMKCCCYWTCWINVMLSPFSKMRPSRFLFCVFMCTSSASSKTRFMYSSNPTMHPSILRLICS